MWKSFSALTLILGFSFSFVLLPSFAQAKEESPPPKCEKCYRGPDGKIKCDPVECPK